MKNINLIANLTSLENYINSNLDFSFLWPVLLLIHVYYSAVSGPVLVVDSWAFSGYSWPDMGFLRPITIFVFLKNVYVLRYRLIFFSCQKTK